MYVYRTMHPIYTARACLPSLVFDANSVEREYKKVNEQLCYVIVYVLSHILAIHVSLSV